MAIFKAFLTVKGDHIDKTGKEVENWQDDHRLNLINKHEDQPTFYSRRWRTTSTPDLVFCTDGLDGQINREVREQPGGNDHRSVLLTMNTYISFASMELHCCWTGRVGEREGEEEK